MVLVVLSIGISYINHYAGLWQEKLTQKSIWLMNEEELRKFCKLKGIRKPERIEFVVLKIIHNATFTEISDRVGYSVDAIKDWSPVCKQKLGITDWNN